MLDPARVPPRAPLPREIPCPVEFAVRQLGGKWKLLVVRALLFDTRLRYNELLSGIRGMSPKELTRNLRELEHAGLVSRSGSARSQRVEYTLTPLGQDLMPAFGSLAPVGRKLIASLGPDRECE